MNQYSPEYGNSASASAPQNHDQMTQWQNAANNFSGLVETNERYVRNQQKLQDEYNLNVIRGQLIQRILIPLRKSVEVQAAIPLAYLPPLAHQLVMACASAIGVSIEIVLACLLGAMFIAARGNFKIRVGENHIEALTAFIVACAHSGQRKSAANDLFRSVIAECQSEWQSLHAKGGTLAEQKILILALKKAEADTAKRFQRLLAERGCVDAARSEMHEEFAAIDRLRASLKKRWASPKLLVDSPTPESLACQLEQQGEAIGIFEAEGGFWKHRLRPSGDDILLKSYTGESFGSDTKTQGSVFLRAPVVAICTLVQPNVLEALYRDADLVEHGLVPRMLPILAPSQIPYSFQTEVPNELMIWFRSHVRSLLEIERPQGDVDERTFHTLTLTPEAKAEFDLFSQEVGRQMAAGMFEGYQAFGSKLAGHAVRLAGAMHLLKHGSPHHHEIDRDSMISGIALAEFFRQHAKVAFDPCARNGVLYAQKILAWIQRSRPAQFTEREAHRHACSRANIDQVRAGLDELERHNFIWRYVTGKSPICVVHPHAYGYIG